MDLSVDRFASSYSNDQGGHCVEAGRMGGGMAVRDSKAPHGPAFVFPPVFWNLFVDAVKHGQLSA
ncbi:DUF397 domain-containing protein [Streptomyces sp. NPDC050732]|uniref:DUF397 domain-containing protein n=1 Tax=Streptomyces sp. NPDC050732 TaxID=3154632 RepID=UPI00342B049D